MTVLSIDIETFSSEDLVRCGVYRYTQSKDFEVLLLAFAFDGNPVEIVDLASSEGIPDDVLQALTDPVVVKTAFNANFERICLAQHFNIPMPAEQWHCSAAHAFNLGLPTNLDGVAKCLRLPQQKMREGKALIRYFSLPCKPTKANGGRTRNLPEHDTEKWERFKTYCKQDVEVERGIRQKLEQYPMTDKEHKLWCLDQHINDYGVPVDRELVENAIMCDKNYQKKLLEEATCLTGLANPNSPAQLKRWLQDNHNIQVDSLAKDKVAELLEKADEPTIKRALELRLGMARTSIKKYEAMQRAVGTGRRIRGLLQYYGANRTGRWAGRLVQVQNLPRNNMRDLQLARQLLKAGEYEVLELLFESVPDLLSQLTRTAFIPSPGCRFIVSDFSAIEARVIAWLAGEEWVLDTFKSHGKIYEMTASRMFGVPLVLIAKGNPEYELRQKGKVATLACGYQGSKGALIAMGALKMGLAEDELLDIVTAWRNSNPKIVKLWWNVEKAAIKAVKDGVIVSMQHGLKFYCKGGVLFIKLPSGRSLAYVRPRIELDERFGKDKLTYEGIEQGTKQWGRLSTYGGKMVENCLAADTLVFTNFGWKPLINIDLQDLLWDGEEWVKHDGLIEKGMQRTICLNGVRMTENHLVLTERGWRDASSCQGLKWAEVKLPDCHKIYGFKRKEITVADPLRLWQRVYYASLGIYKRKTNVLRVHEKRADWLLKYEPWYEQTSCLLGVAVNGRPVQATIKSSLEKLWRAGYQGMPQVARKLSELLDRYGAKLSKRLNDRADRRERRLHPGKLQMGHKQTAKPQQKTQPNCEQPAGENDSCRIVRADWDRCNHFALPYQSPLSQKTFTRSAGFYEPVYDIVNSGKRNRFTVLSTEGPIIVHNCVQAIARDCLAESMLRLDAAGYKIAFHVHDEVVLDVPHGFGSLKDVEEIMSQPIDWAPGLPLDAAGFETDFYMKD